MNTRAKGNRARLKVIRAYEKAGYVVAVVERTGRFIKQKDMFGLFDLVALHELHGYSFIQITSTKPHSHNLFSDFASKYYLCNGFVEIVQYVSKGRNKFDIYRYKVGEIVSTRNTDIFN